MGNSLQLRQRYIDNFTAYLESRELAQNTVQSYTSSIEHFFKRYDEVTKENGLRWKKELMEEGLKPKSVNVRLNAFNAYCTMIQADHAKVKTLRVHSATAVGNVISAEDYKRLLDGLLEDGNRKWYFNIRLLASTGARVSEYVRLTKSDLDRGYAELWTKGKVRRIYIPKSFIEESASYYANFAPKEYLVQNRNGKQITDRGVSQMLRCFSKRYGIDKKVMHPHSFRHLFALEFLKRNNNLSLLADVMGHSSVSTTAIYTRMTKEQQADAVDHTINW